MIAKIIYMSFQLLKVWNVNTKWIWSLVKAITQGVNSSTKAPVGNTTLSVAI